MYINLKSVHMMYRNCTYTYIYIYVYTCGYAHKLKICAHDVYMYSQNTGFISSSPLIHEAITISSQLNIYIHIYIYKQKSTQNARNRRLAVFQQVDCHILKYLRSDKVHFFSEIGHHGDSQKKVFF